MLLAVASSKRDSAAVGGTVEETSRARARREQRYQRSLAHSLHTRHSSGAAENPQKHTKQRPTSLRPRPIPPPTPKYTRARTKARVYEERRDV